MYICILYLYIYVFIYIWAKINLTKHGPAEETEEQVIYSKSDYPKIYKLQKL